MAAGLQKLRDATQAMGVGREPAALEWLAAGTSPQAIEAIRRHPAFDDAAVLGAQSLVEAYQGSRLLNRVMNDRARAVFALMVLYLHSSPDRDGTRLTTARMVAFCADTELCSRGRAKAMLALLQWSGYIERGPETDDRRVRPLVPTPLLWEAVRLRWTRMLDAFVPVDSLASDLRAAIEDQAFAADLAVELGTAFHSGFRVLDGAPIFIDMAERDGGMMVMFALFIAEHTGQEMPSIASLARRFHLSRAQVLGLIREAEMLGLLRRDGRGIVLEPALGRQVGDFFATAYAIMCSAGRHLLQPKR